MSMASPLQADVVKESTGAGAAANAVQGLLRRVVKRLSCVGAPAAARVGPDPARDVILATEIDGVRCVFIRRPAPASPERTTLSPRECEIARMVAKGYPNKTIARVLEISSWTVGTYLRRIFAKLGVGSRAAMVARWLEGGLLGEQQHAAQRPARLQ
jgi:DNA-binding CsgD family transcriptional regulator